MATFSLPLALKEASRDSLCEVLLTLGPQSCLPLER